MTTTANGRRTADNGHTLLEVAAVLAIVAVASALSYPALAGLRRGQELEAAAMETAQCLRLAHWRAVGAGTAMRVAVLPGHDGRWLLRLERAAGVSWVGDGEERRLPRGVVVSVAGPTEKVFYPDGTCSFGSVTLRGAGDATYRCTLMPATSRVRLYRGDREVGRGF